MDSNRQGFHRTKLLCFHKTGKGLVDRRETTAGIINRVPTASQYDILINCLGEHSPGETAETGWLVIWKEQAGAPCWGGWDAGKREDMYFPCQTEEECGRTGLEFKIILIWKENLEESRFYSGGKSTTFLEQNICVKIKEKTITHLEKGSEADHDVKKQKAIHGKEGTLPTDLIP